MSDESTPPIEVEQIDCAPLGRAKVAVRVTGRWRGRRRTPDGRAFLVIEAEGRRHRFPAVPEPSRSRLGRPGSWSATFALPSWLEPHLGGAMTLWFGNLAIPLEGPSYVPQLADVPGDAHAPDGPGTDEQPEPAADGSELSPPVEAGPAEHPDLSELQATVEALRAELAQRSATEAQLRGELAGTKAELDGRAAHQEELESTQGKLRDQLAELLKLVEREAEQRSEVESRAILLAGEVAELRAASEQEGAERILLEARIGELSQQLQALRAELAQREVARDAAVGEAAGLRGELERLGAELSTVRASKIGEENGLSEARSLLDEARAATARLRGAG